MIPSKNLLATALAVAMILMSVPVGSANESVTERYILSTGASANGESVGFVVNPPSGIAPTTIPSWVLPEGWVGGAHLRTSTFYNSVVMSASDDSLADTGTAVCFWAFGGDEICDPSEDNPSDASCGVQVLIAPGLWRGAEATVWTFAVVVTPGLEVCGATQGTITGDFFNS